MIKNTLKTVLALSLVAGCGSDEQEQPKPEPAVTEQRQQGVRAADATSKLLALGNASIGGTSIGQRANAVEDLVGDIEAGIDEFIESLDDVSCLTFVVTETSDTQVDISFDFAGCEVDGLEDVIGDLDIVVTSDEDGVECDYTGDLSLEGIDIDGSWSIDDNEVGTGEIDGELSIVLPDGSAIALNIDSSWKLGDGECPELDQHFELTIGGAAVTVDLAGLDLCAGSLCGSGVDVVVEDASGLAEIDFADLVPDIDGIGDGLVCGPDGDLDWDPELDDDLVPDLDV